MQVITLLKLIGLNSETYVGSFTLGINVIKKWPRAWGKEPELR